MMDARSGLDRSALRDARRARMDPHGRTRLEWRIARRYLRSRRTARTASLNTVISTGGVAVGVTALIVVLGVMNGLRDDLRERILVANPHLRILTFGSGLRLDDWRERDRRGAEAARACVAASPEVISQAGITAGQDYGEGCQPGRASIPTPAACPSPRCPRQSTKGDLSFKATQARRGRRDPARLPARLPALRLSGRHRHPGPGHSGQDQPGARRRRAAVLEVRGHRPVRHRHVPVRQPVRGHVPGNGAAVHRAGRRGVGHRGAGGRSGPGPDIGDALEERLGYPYRALDWQTQNSSLFSALQLEKLAMGLIIFFIMVVAAFNIVGTLTMVVTDKTREIGILRAMGLTSPAVARVFLIQGAVIGVVGTHAGADPRADRGLRGGQLRLDQDQSRGVLHRSSAGTHRAGRTWSWWC